MLDHLHAAEKELPRLLRSSSGWKSLRVDYHAPFVDRVYRDLDGHRLCLHRIHPCAPADALFHPHPWPSAMRIHSGTYEMGVGYGRGDAPPPVAARLVATGPLEYEMTDPDAWHYVRPIGGPALTVMLSGPPWGRSAPRSERPLAPLPDGEVECMLELYRVLYPAA
jgi:hypothetical protein